jgi:hypothetical protein
MAGSIHFPEELRPELAETLDRSRDLLQKRGRLLEESRNYRTQSTDHRAKLQVDS